MTSRLTRTEYLWANNQIIGSYLVPIEPPQEEIDKHFSNIIEFHNDYILWIKQETDKHGETAKVNLVWHNVYINIPLTAIETFINYPRYMIYGSVTHLTKDIKIAELYYKNLIIEINKDPSSFSMENYQKLLENANMKLLLFLNDAIIKPEKDFTNEQLSLIMRYYIALFPLLKQLKIVYYNIIFNRYLLSIHNIKPHDIAFQSYLFIKTYLHGDCIAQNSLFKTMFYHHFQTLKDLKNIDGIPSLNYKQKQKLFKFIVYLKTYAKLVSHNIFSVNDSDPLPQDHADPKWVIYHYRETKRYFHKFFGNKADFSSYLQNIHVKK